MRRCIKRARLKVGKMGRDNEEKQPFSSQPGISVVTPSFNQASFLRSCIESVRRQSVTAVEHLIFDPGSIDGSREIAASFSEVSLIAEADDGQADAVGRGFGRARGEILGWLNSDDEYFDETVFASVLARFAEPDHPDIVYGRGVWVDAEGKETKPVWMNEAPERLLTALHESVGIAQPALFLRRSVVDAIGVPDKRLHFALDYEYWIRAAQAGLKFAFLDRPLAKLRYYPENKTAGKRGQSYAEVCKVVKEKYGYVPVKWLRRYAEFNLSGADGIFVHNVKIEPATLDAEVARLAAVYNFDKTAIDAMTRNADAEPQTSNLRYHQQFTEFKNPPWRKIPLEQQTLPGHQCYTVGERRFAFQHNWLQRQFERTRGVIEYVRRTRRSDSCVLVGNGPSLNLTDFALLDGQDVFASNYAFLHKQLAGRVRFLSVVNYTVAEQGAFDFQSQTDCFVFAPYWLRYAIHEADHLFFVKSVGYPEFSADPNVNISWRSTVSFFNMQLAYGLGYRKVNLIGFDHSYVQDAKREGDMIEQKTEDVNHFSPYYFYNKNWQAADTAQMENMYRLAKDAFAADRREIVNCTVGGKLEIFRRSTLANELPRVSSLNAA
jgi:glycosyltransferase involved in cell wall biosynthesis